MPFIVNQSINPIALRCLQRLDQVILFATEGITYPAISNHPDIFFCMVDELLLASKAVPEPILRQISDAGVAVEIVPDSPGIKYPASAIFNAVVTAEYLIHRTDITHISIKKRSAHKTPIHVNQAYTRCNLFVPDQSLWLTSDTGIARALATEGIASVHVDPRPVRLEGFPHGFFGGCCGVSGTTLLVNGSLRCLPEEDQLREAAETAGYTILELCSGPPVDVGGIFSL